MAKKDSKKQSRKDPGKISAYWSWKHVPNQLVKAKRIFREHGDSEARKFVTLHPKNCKPCENLLEIRYLQWRKEQEATQDLA